MRGAEIHQDLVELRASPRISPLCSDIVPDSMVEGMTSRRSLIIFLSRGRDAKVIVSFPKACRIRGTGAQVDGRWLERDLFR
jgi:hypothetical protein